MDNLFLYQIKLYKQFSKFCSFPFWKYPPYCSPMDYFEEYFYINFFKSIQQKDIFIDYVYIPITWTYVLKTNEWILKNNSTMQIIQSILNELNPEYKYFTVCMHDNAPILKLPNFTKNFSAGHCCQKSSPMFNNLDDSLGDIFTNKMEDFRENIPIPLIVKNKISEFIPKNAQYQKKYLASFVGSNSHDFRNILNDQYKDNSNFFINVKDNLNMENSINDVGNFIEKSLQSYFVLCPRGWGPTSYRLYESMQLNCVPVYISDIFWLPYKDEINWHNLCVFIKPSEIYSLESILKKEIEIGNYHKKLEYIRNNYDKYFAFENMYIKILKNIKCGMP